MARTLLYIKVDTRVGCAHSIFVVNREVEWQRG